VWDGLPGGGGRDRFTEDVLREQFRTSDRLDGRAGALLGFAGLLAAVAGQLKVRDSIVVVAVAVLAAFCALVAAFPRRLLEPDPTFVDTIFAQLPDDEATQIVADSRLRGIEKNAGVLGVKRRWLSAAAVLLFAAGATTGIGMLLPLFL
jgi:hypothetical protein